MAQDWVELTGDDLWKVVSRDVVEKADEDVQGGTHEDGDIDTSLDTRAKRAVEFAVAEVRGAIESASMMPLSVAAGRVPPELQQAALALAAYRLALPKPTLLAAVMNEGGVYAPVGKLYAEAQEWLKKLRAGANVTQPTDPTGRDYLTAVADDNPAISRVFWGDSVADDREYEAGLTDSGKVVNDMSNDMNTW